MISPRLGPQNGSTSCHGPLAASVTAANAVCVGARRRALPVRARSSHPDVSELERSPLAVVVGVRDDMDMKVGAGRAPRVAGVAENLARLDADRVRPEPASAAWAHVVSDRPLLEVRVEDELLGRVHDDDAVAALLASGRRGVVVDVSVAAEDPAVGHRSNRHVPDQVVLVLLRVAAVDEPVPRRSVPAVDAVVVCIALRERVSMAGADHVRVVVSDVRVWRQVLAAEREEVRASGDGTRPLREPPADRERRLVAAGVEAELHPAWERIGEEARLRHLDRRRVAQADQQGGLVPQREDLLSRGDGRAGKRPFELLQTDRGCPGQLQAHVEVEQPGLLAAVVRRGDPLDENSRRVAGLGPDHAQLGSLTGRGRAPAHADECDEKGDDDETSSCGHGTPASGTV